MLDTSKIADLKATQRGQLIEATDPAYEEARALYNGMIDKRPLAIARCVDVADVITAAKDKPRGVVVLKGATTVVSNQPPKKCYMRQKI